MRRSLMGVALLACACGGGSSNPTMPTEAPSLVAGKYALQVTSTGAGCLTTTFGAPVGPPPPPTITVDLDVAADGSGWRGTSSDPSRGALTMTGTITDRQFRGALDGVVSDGAKSVAFLARTHVMVGSSTGKANELAGGFPAGTLVVFIAMGTEAGAWTVTCPNVGWVLSPR